MNNEDGEAISEREDHLDPIGAHLAALAVPEVYPDVALALCTLRIEEAAPALRAILVKAADGATLSEEEDTLLFRGVHVLGAARDRIAFQPLLRFLRRADVDDLLGDAIHETLAKIIAGVFDGDAELLFAAIADASIDEYARNALFGAATFLTWEGRIERVRMQRFLEQFYEERSAPDDDYAWIAWLESIAFLGMRDLAPLVEKAWQEERVPEGIMKLSHFEEDLAAAERDPADTTRFEPVRLGYIEDVVDTLNWSRPRDRAVEPLPTTPWAASSRPTPVTNPFRNVGRNDPCPCGSGKKAKKCCLANH